MRLILALLLALLPFSAPAQTIDYDIANQTFPNFRSDLNNHLSAIVQHNAGTTAPSTTFPYMVWVDTSGATPIYRYRNAANNAWITAFEIEAGASEWLGKVTTSSATITGGSIDSTPIGQGGRAAANVTTLSATGNITVERDNPSVIWRDTAGSIATHSASRWVQTDIAGTPVFALETLSDSGSFVASDYVISKGANGATQHSWRTNGVEMFRIQAPGSTADGYETFFFDNVRFNAAPMFYGTLFPASSGTIQIGSTSLRWSGIFLTSAPNVSSDARLKHDVGDVQAAECRVADRIEVRRYRLDSEDDGPWHFGAIAQEVIAAFAAEGLDWQDYAIVTGSEADTYGIAYDELQALKLACL